MYTDKILEEFKEKLEETLDEYFPKVQEEGEEKRLMKRSQALALFSKACLLNSQSIQQAIAEEKESERKRKLEVLVDSLHEMALKASGVEELTLEEMKDLLNKYITQLK